MRLARQTVALTVVVGVVLLSLAQPAWAGPALPSIGGRVIAPCTPSFSQAPGSPIPAGSNPSAAADGDFNNDDNRDLAVTNSGSNNVTILLGNGSGGFAPAPGSPIPVGVQPFGVAVGSFNGDGNADLATANFASNDVTILLGNGNGTLAQAPGSPIPVGISPRGMVVTVINQDVLSDVATANLTSNNVTILLDDCNLADLGVSVTDSPDPVTAGADLTYTITVFTKFEGEP